MTATTRVGPSLLLRDAGLAEHVDEVGFASTGRLYDDDDVAELTALYRRGMERLGRPLGEAWVPTALLDDPEVRALFWDGIRSIAGRCLADLLDPRGAEVFGGEFAVKPPGEAGGIGFHQGFSVVDEDRFVSLDTWAPLIDSTMANGTLRLVPGSHLLPNTPHLSVAPDSFGGAEEALAHREVAVEAVAGEVMLFDTRVVHRSLPNRSGTERVAVRALIKPAEAPLLFYFADHATPEGEAEVYEVADRFYVDHSVFARPGSGAATAVGSRPRRRLSGPEVVEALDRMTPTGADADSVEGGPGLGASTPWSSRGIFTDPTVQERFERDGYVVIPLLEPEEIAALDQLYCDLDPVLDGKFHSSQESDDPNYRETVAANVLRITDRGVRTHLAGGRSVAAGLLVKPPSEDTRIWPHQDWSMVDESQFVSVLAWCPLIDTDLETGMISVVAGSHRLGPTWRGRDIPKPYDGLEEEIAAHHLTPVPCRAGEAVLFDSRLLHGSPPNRSGRIRPVAAVSVISAEAELLHFDLDESGRVRRHVVDDDFFRQVSVYNGGLPATESTEIIDVRLPKFETYQLPRPERPQADPSDVDQPETAEATDPVADEPGGATALDSSDEPTAPPPGPNTLYASLPASLRQGTRKAWSALPEPVRGLFRPGLGHARRLLTVHPRTSSPLGTRIVTTPGRLRSWWLRRDVDRTFSSTDVATYYDEWTERYEAVFGDIFQHLQAPDTDELLGHMAEVAGLEPGMRVVDAGCGVCGPATWFASRIDGLMIDAVTISPRQAERARALVAERGLSDRITVHVGDFHDLGALFESGSIDAVYFLEALVHAHDPRQVLESARKVLRPGGALYAKDFYRGRTPDDPEWQRVIDECVAATNRVCHLTIRDTDDMLGWLKEAGFGIEVAQPLAVSAYDITAGHDFCLRYDLDVAAGRDPRTTFYLDNLEIRARKPGR